MIIARKNQRLNVLLNSFIGNHNYSTTTQSKKTKWKSVVGLEVHAQIASMSKLFSGSSVEFGGPINNCVALLDASIPGTLPVLNKRCVEAGVQTALALSSNINEVSMFDRKHYFYADLPAGYQITQQRAPLAKGGSMTFPVFIPGVTKKPYYKTVRLTQLQLEQDSGKSLHDDILGRSLVDLNRAGVPLMEFVFEPDLSDGEEAAALVKELVLILTRLGVCNCKMEEGGLRVDANISIHEENEPLGVRTEVKNIGSIRGVAQAVAFEIQRQIEIKDNGGSIKNATRAWDANTKTTIAMRDKEVVQDYRFMPEPNLPPLHLNLTEEISKELINVQEIKKCLPELPECTRNHLMTEMKLPHELAIILVNEDYLLGLFKQIIKTGPQRNSKVVALLLVNELLTVCHKNKISVEDCKILPNRLGPLIDMLESEYLSIKLASLILEEMLKDHRTPQQISDDKGWKLISDDKEIRKICEEAIATNLKLVTLYQSGKTKVLLAIIGEIAKKTENRINMRKVTETLKQMMQKK